MPKRDAEENKIKSKGESHSRGWQAHPKRLGRERRKGGSSRLRKGPQHAGPYTVPRSLRRHPVTMVAGLGRGVWLADTWDLLGMFPSHTSGVSGSERKGGLGVVCAGFAPAASGGGAGEEEPLHHPAPKE